VSSALSCLILLVFVFRLAVMLNGIFRKINSINKCKIVATEFSVVLCYVQRNMICIISSKFKLEHVNDYYGTSLVHNVDTNYSVHF
jgi:hypothetical protein